MIEMIILGCYGAGVLLGIGFTFGAGSGVKWSISQYGIGIGLSIIWPITLIFAGVHVLNCF